jgi:hypothetical protein
LTALTLSAAMPGCFESLAGRPVAYDFITDDRYTSLLIEIDYVTGKQPHGEAVSLLEQRAKERLSKPGGISSQISETGGGRSQWSTADLRAYEDEHRNFKPQGSRMTLYVLYVDGEFTDAQDVIGVHYGPSSIAIFKDQIVGGSLFGFSARDGERAVLIHELGHAMGLVNTQIPMVRDHEDKDHRGHSSNRNSVMYHEIETRDIALLTGTPPNQFDENDIADIRAAGGK